MKHLLLIFIVISLFSCSNGPENKTFDIDGRYYIHATKRVFDTIEKIHVTSHKSNDSLVFTYDYKVLHDGIDTLIILGDSIILKNTKPKFISNKSFLQKNGENFDVNKYYYTSGHPHSNINFYISKTKGIILSKTENELIAEYHFDSGSQNLIENIISDSTFFKFE